MAKTLHSITFSFIKYSVRKSKEKICGILVEHNDIKRAIDTNFVIDMDADNWDDAKLNYPTIKDILANIAERPEFDCKVKNIEVTGISGYEDLYDDEEVDAVVVY